MNGAVPAADSMAKIQHPVMLLSGSKDGRIGAGMPAVDSMMKALGKSYSGTNYDGAIHGFMRAQDDPKPATPQCDEACANKERADNLAATKDGWPKTIAFLKKNLGVAPSSIHDPRVESSAAQQRLDVVARHREPLVSASGTTATATRSGRARFPSGARVLLGARCRNPR